MLYLLGLYVAIGFIGLIVLRPREFFSTLWRLALGSMLLISFGCLIAPIMSPRMEYGTQFMIMGAIGLALSGAGLVRSFLKKKSIS